MNFLYSVSLVFSNVTILDKLNKEFGRVLPTLMFFKNSADDPCVISSRIREYFLNNSNVTGEDFGIVESMLSDRLKTHCIRKMGDELSKFTSIYLYNFTQHWSQLPNQPPAHFWEVIFLFKYSQDSLYHIIPEGLDYEMSKNMVALWVSFARDG